MPILLRQPRLACVEALSISVQGEGGAGMSELLRNNFRRHSGCQRDCGRADGLVVVIAFLRFVVPAEMDSDEPSAVASREELANLASHRISSFAHKRGTLLAHSGVIKAPIFRLS